MEKSDKDRILSHFSPSHKPFVIHYLVLHFSEVWKCGILSRVSPSHEPFAIPYLLPTGVEV